MEEGAWRQQPWFLMKRQSHCSVSVEADKIIIIGGYNSDYGALDYVQELSLVDGTAAHLTKMNTARHKTNQ